MPVDLSPLLDEATDIIPFETPKSPDTKAHIVSPPENPHLDGPGVTSQDIVDMARVRGIVIKALCGYKFIPRHNPDKLDACDKCFEIAGMLLRDAGE